MDCKHVSVDLLDLVKKPSQRLSSKNPGEELVCVLFTGKSHDDMKGQLHTTFPP